MVVDHIKDKKKSEQPLEKKEQKKNLKKEIGGQDGPEPTRFGDWEKKGITSDFQLSIHSFIN